MVQKISRLAPQAPPESELVEREWKRHSSVVFHPFLGWRVCPGLVLVSSPVAKSAYKQHRYRNKCTAEGSIYAWALSVGTNVPRCNQNALLVCSLIPPKPLQLAHTQLPQLPSYLHTVARSSIMGLKWKSTWQKPGLTVYIYCPVRLKKKIYHNKE